ncbi:MAG: hypothetical protein IJ088_07185 [Clostridia bacterium]|nr:hypothetical protein [Clostridia bacterium]
MNSRNKQVGQEQAGYPRGFMKRGDTEMKWLVRIMACCLVIVAGFGIFFVAGHLHLTQEKKEPEAAEIQVYNLAPRTVRKEFLSFNPERKNIGIYLSTVEVDGSETIPDLLAWFEEWYGTSSRDKIEMCGQDHIAVPFITWEPSNISFNDISEGKHDEYLRGYFERLAMLCPDNDVLIRFAHEMEVRPQNEDQKWYSWQGDADVFREAWIHIVSLAHSINSNIKWVWSPNRIDRYAAPYYPGDDYVDYIGCTLNIPLDQTRMYPTFDEVYEKIGKVEEIRKYNKKIIISETAFCDGDEEAKKAYLRSAIDHLAGDGQMSALCFFNEDVSDVQLYRITDKPQYRDIIDEGIRRFRNENKAEEAKET